MIGTDDEAWMRLALRLAGEAADSGEVPVGCVVVRGDKAVGRGRNRCETLSSAVAHAEMEAIGEACRTLGGWRLEGCRLYVTLEPCPMCAGAIWNARIPEVFYGASDPAAGACGGLFHLFYEDLHFSPQITGGVLGDECALLLSDFFRRLRT